MVKYSMRDFWNAFKASKIFADYFKDSGLDPELIGVHVEICEELFLNIVEKGEVYKTSLSEEDKDRIINLNKEKFIDIHTFLSSMFNLMVVFSCNQLRLKEVVESLELIKKINDINTESKDLLEELILMCKNPLKL